MKKLLCCLTSVIMAVMLFGVSIDVVRAGPCELPDFDSTDFTTPQSNDYFPIPGFKKGTTYVYEAETEDELIKNVIYISKDTTTILGIKCTVVYDTEWVYVEDTETWYMTEETEDWLAWDNSRNVWYFGEWTTEYEYDDYWEYQSCNHDGSWEAGQDVADVGSIAEPGIIIPANPAPGACYKQEYYEDEAEDVGKVLRLDAKVSVEYDDYEDCMSMKEWTPLEPGNVEHKYYAPNVGLVFIEELKEKTVMVELVDKYSGPPKKEDLPAGSPVCP